MDFRKVTPDSIQSSHRVYHLACLINISFIKRSLYQGHNLILTGSTFVEPAELLSVHSKVSGAGKASTKHSTLDGSCSAAPISFTSLFRQIGLSAGKVS